MAHIIKSFVLSTSKDLADLTAKDEWLYSVAAEISNLFYPFFICRLCKRAIPASATPNFQKSFINICLQCVCCHYCQDGAALCYVTETTQACIQCLKTFVRFHKIIPPLNALSPSPFSHSDHGVTRVFYEGRCFTLSHTILLACQCNNHDGDKDPVCVPCGGNLGISVFIFPLQNI